MTSWTKLKALSQRTHRVTLGGCRAWGGWLQGPSPSSLAQLLPSAGPPMRLQKYPGSQLPSRKLGLPGCPSAHSTHRFYVADSLYRQSTSEFRVASSVEQLNIIEVGAWVAEGQGQPAGLLGEGWALRAGCLGAMETELHNHSLMSTLARVSLERGLGPPLLVRTPHP